MSGVLVHEWIARSGGSENVLEAFGQIFPSEPIVCSVFSRVLFFRSVEMFSTAATRPCRRIGIV